MKLSVIIPIYNVEQYLCKALDSVVNQSYKDIEIICVNDGSTDNCKKIIEDYASRDSRVIVVNQENAGLYAVRQTGVKIATGDYITYVDGDDWLDLDAYEKIMTLAEQSNADIIQYGVVVESPTRKDPIIKSIEKWFEVDVKSINDSDEMIRRCYIERTIPWNIATKVIKASVAKIVASYQSPLRINQLEDFLACYYLFLLSKSWVYLDSKLYHYRYGTGISTKRTITSKEFEKNLVYYEGVKSLQHFAEEMKPSDTALKVAFEVIPQYAKVDSMQLVMRLDDKDDYCRWSDIWAKAAGTEEVLHAVAASMLRFNEKWMHAEKRMKKKRAKYRLLLWIMGAVTVALLVALLSVEL
jgi:glycosyltransferase involved in cell wall biosynthesis